MVEAFGAISKQLASSMALVHINILLEMLQENAMLSAARIHIKVLETKSTCGVPRLCSVTGGQHPCLNRKDINL